MNPNLFYYCENRFKSRQERHSKKHKQTGDISDSVRQSVELLLKHPAARVCVCVCVCVFHSRMSGAGETRPWKIHPE